MSVTAVPLQPVKSSYKIWLWLGIIVAIAGAFLLAWVGTGEQRALSPKSSNEQFLAWNKGRIGVRTTASGLQYQIIKPGEGPTAVEGDVVLANYEGTFRDGKLFDKSAQPTPFQMQEGASIPGFFEGLKLMQKGGVYRLWIPAKLAYGDKSPDPERLPPNSMLIFKVSVDRIVDAATVRAMMQQRMQGMAPGGPGGPPPGAEGQAPPPGAESQAPPQ